MKAAGLIAENRYLLMRRGLQISILLLFIGANRYGWKLLQGNLSTSKLMGAVYFADPFSLLQSAAAGAVVALPALVGGLIVFSFFALAGGRMFCSWICPMNMVTDLANRVGRAIGSALPADSLLSRKARYWTIVLSLLLSMLLGVAAFEWISPVSMLHRGAIFGMAAGWSSVLAVFLFDLLVLRHGFCGHLCPLGGFYAVIGRYSLLRVRHVRSRCTLCMECVENCPEKQVLGIVGKRDGLVLSGECTNCAKCIEVCNERAMGFAARFASLSAQKDLPV